jgi:membrane protease YdiL (CAAX protease family)
MKSLNISQRLILFLLLVLALTCFASPWVALGANWFAARSPDILTEQIPFSRVFNRSFMIVAILLLIAGRRLLIPRYLKELIVIRVSAAWLSLLTGFALSVASMALLLALMAAADIYTPYFRLSLERSMSRFTGAVVSGVVAGFMEEIFFRGLFFLGLYDPDRPLRAYVLANLFYSAIHFVKPNVAYFMDPTDPLAGFRHLSNTFQSFVEPLQLLPGMFGLFLIGVVLSFALVRTGHLYLGIGLHAGWIVGLKMTRVFGDFTREQLGWAFGDTDPKIISGVATWIGVLLVGLAVRRLTEPHSRLATDRPPAATV